MSKSWTLNEMPDQTGRRVLITGANSGIGYQTAVGLARRGATVVMACRNLAKGRAALLQLRKDAPGAAAERAELTVLELASLESIKETAARELALGLALDGLINNAGVMGPKRSETEDGFELQFGTNVLGHFALTMRLLPALERAQAARVVTVSSLAHRRGTIHFDDLQGRERYRPMEAYQQSKLGNLMFSLELERRLRARESRVISLAVHPGIAATSLFKVGSSKGLAAVAESLLQRTIGGVLNSDVEGALPTLFAATALEAQGGGYYGPQRMMEMRGGDVGPAQIASQAQDESAQRRLWEACVELTGVGSEV
jgi:NAD(P)-dependent dehydrogenase (short-subunit alcohol dehydrogenase family)